MESRTKKAAHALKEEMERQISTNNGYNFSVENCVFIGRNFFNEDEMPAWSIKLFDSEITRQESYSVQLPIQKRIVCFISGQMKARDPRNPGDTILDLLSDLEVFLNKNPGLTFINGIVEFNFDDAQTFAGISEDEGTVFAAIGFTIVLDELDILENLVCAQQIEMSPCADGISINFAIEDWMLIAGRYQLDLSHNLGTQNLIAQYRDTGGGLLSVESLPIDFYTLRIFVPVNPDGRFTGTAYIEKV